MKPARPTRARRPVATWLALGLALALAAPAGQAGATADTLKRSVANLVFGPFDFVLGPITGARSVYNNLRDIDDTMAVRAVYAVPGWAWNSSVQMGGGVLRTFTGALEFLPGLILIPFDADMDPMFAPAERGLALIDEEFESTGPIKIGISYVD